MNQPKKIPVVQAEVVGTHLAFVDGQRPDGAPYGGVAEVPTRGHFDPAAGQRIRERRVSWRVYLHEAAAVLGLTVPELSGLELASYRLERPEDEAEVLARLDELGRSLGRTVREGLCYCRGVGVVLRATAKRPRCPLPWSYLRSHPTDRRGDYPAEVLEPCPVCKAGDAP